ncbi:hypothetical protein [Mycolicibacterium sp. P1-18]|uniref:hypothetical protein n=1 Tax=Mycolicibacterium sp. P1-18 TaxID=2024615 RepID=UPI001F5BBEDB|nr:hypothetical protein [Mycolicibacterium sp. P1-18]
MGKAPADDDSDELDGDDSRSLPLVADSDSEDDDPVDDSDDSDDPDDDVEDSDDSEDFAADEDSAVLEPEADVGVDGSVRAAAEPSVVSGAALDDDGVDEGDGVDDCAGALVVTAVDVVGLLVAEVTGASRCGAGAVLVAAGSGSEAGSGATGSGARVCFGASAVGSWVGWTTGAGASTTGAGMSATDGFSAGLSAGFSAGAWVAAAGGSGAIVVVGTDGSSPGLAKAGATPPVSAVREITTPEARTAHAVRFRQIFTDVLAGARIVHRLLTIFSPTPLVADQ